MFRDSGTAARQKGAVARSFRRSFSEDAGGWPFTVKIAGCNLLDKIVRRPSPPRAGRSASARRNRWRFNSSHRVPRLFAPKPDWVRATAEKALRFLGKYELVEQHTVGTVETFSAHPIGGNELLLVHLFSLPALTKADPSNRDLLDYLERICPPTLGRVLDGGQYDDGSQAYIITKFPRDPDALRDWVEAYNAMPRATAKLASKPASKSRFDDSDPGLEPLGLEPLGLEPWNDRVSSPPPTPPVEKPAGEFTRMFQALTPAKAPEKAPPKLPAAPTGKSPATAREGDWMPEAPSAVRPAAPQPHANRSVYKAGGGIGRGTGRGDRDFKSAAPHPPEDGSFTDQFAGLGEGAKLPASRFPEEPDSLPPVKNRKPNSWAMPEVPEPPPEPPKERAGEFTKFFRSPFAAPPPAEPPSAPPPDFVNRPAPARSDFTQLFGSASGGSQSPVAPEPLLEPPGQSERGNFTETFGQVRPASSLPPVPPWIPEKPADPPEKVDRGGEYFISNTNSLPISPGKRDAEPAFRPSTPVSGRTFGSKHEEGATRVFKAPVHDEPPPLPPAPEGESQYTRIIRGPKKEPAGSAASAPPAAPAAGGGMPFALTPPVMPKVSVAMPPMQMPSATVSAPQVPHLQIPPVTLAPPKLPPGPKLPAAKKAGTWATHAPLIIILNLIFLAAVGLVLYFAFKP